MGLCGHTYAVFTAIRNATSSISGDTADPHARKRGVNALKKCNIVLWYFENLKNEQTVCTSMILGINRFQIGSPAMILMQDWLETGRGLDYEIKEWSAKMVFTNGLGYPIMNIKRWCGGWASRHKSFWSINYFVSVLQPKLVRICCHLILSFINVTLC